MILLSLVLKKIADLLYPKSFLVKLLRLYTTTFTIYEESSSSMKRVVIRSEIGLRFEKSLNFMYALLLCTITAKSFAITISI